MSNDFLDDCNFIWKEYQKAGYLTYYAEDQRNHSAFNKRHKGFRKEPTDHYFRTFVVAAEKNLEMTKYGDLAFCLAKTVYLDQLPINAMKLLHIHEPGKLLKKKKLHRN